MLVLPITSVFHHVRIVQFGLKQDSAIALKSLMISGFRDFVGHAGGDRIAGYHVRLPSKSLVSVRQITAFLQSENDKLSH
jgi:hypothetical protein